MAILLLWLVASACGGSESSEFRDEQLRWREAGISSYSITYLVQAGINGRSTLTTKIVDGEVVEHQGDGRLDIFEARTVEDMFDEIDAADAATVTFSSEFGYPRKVSLDVHADAIDDEYGWEVLSFTTE